MYRRLAKRGLTLEATNADRVKSNALGCFLRAVGVGSSTRLRVAQGPRGDELFPTTVERLSAEARARQEAERIALEERAQRERADAEIATLRKKLASLDARRER